LFPKGKTLGQETVVAFEKDSLKKHDESKKSSKRSSKNEL
jgi:hypothetical protein